jgi:hypothetical protein
VTSLGLATGVARCVSEFFFGVVQDVIQLLIRGSANKKVTTKQESSHFLVC